MQNTETLKRHAALVDRMAETLGLDLEELALRGALPIPEIDDAVLRCTGCSNPEGCEHWLDTQGQQAEATPRFCRNADLFDALKRGDNVG
ncbi:DUF6455 family protein [Aestuariicoccus sp. MJ-SS9]|uniref:DUF6455 family protein n=1 Tax=Aestuariicoccus sp. MJ-SS9 TaxID=3079855 RepID=UPI002912859B|nr:DUF6455 family protein [Aestuariicoccus sp. MJ-SS9]MDU8910065.1 DUF6455 family protein [Aestuariicoccus sp. MJ-SS9]